MRFKRQKRHRRVVRFYAACFGFRQPFKVLCDGTFVHHLLSNRIVPADNALAKTIGGPIKLFTTRCVLSELKALGQSYSEAFDAASRLLIARCDHERRKSAEACISDVIGESNAEHFFVATQDTDLRKKLQEIPGVPLVYGLRNALFMEQPSVLQRQFVKSSEEERLHMSELERDLLKKRKYRVETEETNEDRGLGDQNLETQAMKKRSTSNELKDKIQFKRKKAKGPNPLSCKKKKENPSQHPVSEKHKKDNDSAAESRTRKRKRSRKAKMPATTMGTP
ncbi:rRNA-processing protein UTP23 homolog [Momordica charantia]|uniref:rRNA-processing protein UTP23 homolog n=1 Tax=Momordica charantia TaxID=3673 RepID=A0A6J1CLD6_MOMCH|nr:rRNA-processing protein UTP23 homolog [Momordica charantia]